MTKAQFEALMPIMVSDLAGMIARERSLPEEEAVMLLYRSKLYADLADEETKVWHYSTPMLYTLFDEELRTGKIEYPDV